VAAIDHAISDSRKKGAVRREALTYFACPIVLAQFRHMKACLGEMSAAQGCFPFRATSFSNDYNPIGQLAAARKNGVFSAARHKQKQRQYREGAVLLRYLKYEKNCLPRAWESVTGQRSNQLNYVPSLFSAG
jgi:hypothetical protein